VRVAEPHRHVAQQVDRGPAQEGEPGDVVEGLVEVGQGPLQPEGDEDDPGDHREVQIRVGVPGQRVALPAFGRLGQPTLGHQRDDVEVGPPEGGGQPDPEHRGDDDAGGEVGLRGDAERDDGLAEGEDDHQVVALGEVGRDQGPPVHAHHGRLTEVEHDRQHPDRFLPTTVEERGAEQQADGYRRAEGEPGYRVAHRRVAAAGEHVEQDVAAPHDGIGQREGDGPVAEGLGDAEGDDEQAGHRREHGQANRPLLGVDHAGQPRVADPGPPEHSQGEHPPPDARPGRLRRHQRRALREPEDEHEVEEQLQRLDRLLLARLRPDPAQPVPVTSWRRHPSIVAAAVTSGTRVAAATPRLSRRPHRC